MNFLNAFLIVAALTQADVTSAQTPTGLDAREPDATEARMDAKWISAILGMKVETSSGVRLGTVKDVVVDGYGQPKYAVVAYGGVMGLGSKYAAIPWLTVAELLHSDRLLVDQAQLQNAPVLRGAKAEFAQRGWRHEADAYWRGVVASAPAAVVLPRGSDTSAPTAPASPQERD